MTYRENCTLPETLLEQIVEQGQGHSKVIRNR